MGCIFYILICQLFIIEQCLDLQSGVVVIDGVVSILFLEIFRFSSSQDVMYGHELVDDGQSIGLGEYISFLEIVDFIL